MTVTSDFFFSNNIIIIIIRWFRITEQSVILFLKGKSKKEKKRKEKKGENLRTGVVGRVFDFADNHEYFRIFPESHRVVT